jgi:hypothetical protein
LENQNERGYKEELGIGGRLILKWILREIEWGGMNWIDLGQDRDQWSALVNMVMNL